jgi:D-amino-acid dehydrogenase
MSGSVLKIAVVGAGVVGVSTAYALRAQGFEVTVFDRHSSVAEGTSFANAGVLAPGYVTPWAAPGMRSKVLAGLFDSRSPIKLRTPLSAADVAWMWRFQRACKPQTYLATRKHLRDLAWYSRSQRQAIVDKHGLEFDRAAGYTVLWRTAKERDAAQAGVTMLREAGVAVQVLDEAQARALEPALNPHTPFVGALHVPDDEVANCRQYTQLLRDVCASQGVQFIHKAQALKLFSHQPSTKSGSVATLLVANESGERTEHRFDAVVVCAGVGARELLKPLGIHIATVPVYGYSVTARIREPMDAPRSGVMDERYKVSITRMGQWIRAAGMAEIGGKPDVIEPSALTSLYSALDDWFPAAAQMRHVQTWKGARPMLADRAPIIGASGLPGVWLNVGHGSSGWALASGSAALVADLIGGRPPELNATGFAYKI